MARFALLLLVLSTSSARAADHLVIRDVTVIDGTGKAGQPHMVVEISGNRIESIRKVTDSHSSKGSRVIDGRAKFLIPGLWDTHVHLIDIDEPAIPSLVLYGITSVRDMGGDIPKLKAWKEKIASAQLVGPRIKFCGPMLEGKWEQKPGSRTDHWQVSSPEQARETVAKLADAGVDCIKMRTYANAETYFALAAAAKEHHLPLGGHAPWGIDPLKASDAGQTSFEHAYYPWPWDKIAPDDRLRIENRFRTNGSLIVPTLIAWQTFLLSNETITTAIQDVEGKTDPREKLVSAALRKNWTSGFVDVKAMKSDTPESRAGWQKATESMYDEIREMHDHGVGVMAGTDTGATMVFPGNALHQELKLLVDKCGFTPMDSLLTATIIPAKYFGLEKDLGTVQVGKLADLVLLGADPLQDIGNTGKIEAVVLDGRFLGQIELQQLKKRMEAAVAKSYQSDALSPK